MGTWCISPSYLSLRLHVYVLTHLRCLFLCSILLFLWFLLFHLTYPHLTVGHTSISIIPSFKVSSTVWPACWQKCSCPVLLTGSRIFLAVLNPQSGSCGDKSRIPVHDTYWVTMHWLVLICIIHKLPSKPLPRTCGAEETQPELSCPWSSPPQSHAITLDMHCPYH